MNIQAMLEKEKERAQQLAEAKIQAKLHRQLRILKKEKTTFTQTTNFEQSKQVRSLRVLDIEKDLEVDNFLATKSPAIEAKFQYDVGVVRNLVKTRGIVQDLLTTEKAEDHKMLKEIREVEEAILEQKKAASRQEVDHSKLHVPEEDKMDRRVQTANAGYHSQRHRNMALQDAIDNAIYVRKCFQKEEAKLKKEVKALDQQITKVMHEAGNVFEERERVEGTKLKVKEHLARVKEEYERELLGITLALNEDKKSEGFMRTKLKDTAQFLRDQKAVEKQRVEEMLQRKDEFRQAFDQIKQQMGKADMNEIIHDFLEKEEDNFATFLSIGMLMEKNEKLRSEIHELSQSTVKVEASTLDTTLSQEKEIKAIQEQTASLSKKSQECEERREASQKTLQEFMQSLEASIRLLKIDRPTVEAALGREAQMNQKTVLTFLRLVMAHLTAHINDLTLVELTMRATYKSESTADEKMLCRKPSLKIPPIVTPKTAMLPLKGAPQPTGPKQADLMAASEVRDAALREMLERERAAEAEAEKEKEGSLGRGRRRPGSSGASRSDRSSL